MSNPMLWSWVGLDRRASRELPMRSPGRTARPAVTPYLDYPNPVAVFECVS